MYIEIATLFCLCSSANSANILGVFFVPSYSHQIVFQPIWRELSLRGHEVTIITPNPLNDPKLTNLTEIDVSFSYDIMRKVNAQKPATKNNSPIVVLDKTYELMGNLSEAELSHPPVQELIKNKDRHFDVVLVQFLHPAMYALSARFNCPLIGMSSLDIFINGHSAVGNPVHPILYPDILSPVLGDSDLFQRIYGVYYHIYYQYYYYYKILPQQDEIARKYISEDIPYLGDIEKNVSLIFLNVNPIIHSARPNVPSIIQLGTVHIAEKKPLPKDLQIELDEAKQGVIYFSLGSNVRSADLSLELRDTIMKALSELPYKVIWKFEDDHLPGKPKNVVIRKWLPQQDLLGHPNIKAFVTQGGLQSMEEAISNGVPLIGMPFFGDQPLNVAKMVKLGIAQTVDTEKVTSDLLKEAIIEVAENPKYRQRIKEIAKITSDVPMTGLEKAVWWTEYVIRHKGARHLRSPAIDMPWYQYLLLDVIGFVIGVLIIAVFIIYKTIRFLLSIFLTQKKLKTQ